MSGYVRRRRRFAALTVAVATLASMIAVPPSPAVAGDADRGNERARVLTMWRMGGPALREAAGQALIGSDAGIRAFLDAGWQRVSETDDRGRVAEMLKSGGYAVKDAAQRVLDVGTPDAVGQFLENGWATSRLQDLRIRVNQMMAVGGPKIREAAQAALDAGTEEALKTFLDQGWRVPETQDLRIRVNQLMAVGGAKVREMAQRALDAGTIESFQQFLDFDWPLAQARDQETASVAELANVAKVAGELAAQETQAATVASDRAVTETVLAKAAAEKAARATESAKGNAAEAAAAAGLAADAANRAADAARDAVGAATAASNAARVAAAAASRAATAASMAGQAASRAYSAAAAAAKDAGEASNARKAAQAARDIVVGAERAADAAKAAGDAARNAGAAAQAASNAGNNAAAAAQAAVEAGDFASRAGADATRARNAAAAARSQAARATRAAQAAMSFANVAANAADRARTAATRAAADASAAADAADAAAAHAGNAATAAAEATRHANAASTAAQTALDAAAQARQVFDAARTADEERLTIRADAAAEAARNAKAAVQRVEASPKWDADQETLRDTETNRLITEASAAGAEPALVLNHGRRIALRLANAKGEWTKTEATAALTGADAEVREYVRIGIARAAAQDDRLTLKAVIDRGSQALRETADAALAGSDADVRQFLRDPTYPGRDTEDRIKVNNVQSEARSAGRNTTVKAAQKALDANTGLAYRAFLDKEQFTASTIDDRIEVNHLVASKDSGPETKAMAQAVLDGPPSLIRKFLVTDRFVAARRDADSAAHIEEVSGYLAQAASAAATAVRNANEAQATAAYARGAAQEAAGHAEQARNAANDAAAYARQAQESARSAERSAQAAASSARTAKESANRAQTSARQAMQSAIYARASASQAVGFARDAVSSARAAFNSAVAAEKDSKEANAAAEQAYAAATKKINEEIVQAAARQIEYCLTRHKEGSERYKNCVRLISQTNEEKIERAYENGLMCDVLYGHARGGPGFQNCTADALSPDFEANRQIEFLAAGLQLAAVALLGGAVAGAITIATVGVVGCVISVVCGGIMLAASPEGMAFYPAWVAGAYAGAVTGAAGIRVAAQLESVAVEMGAVQRALAKASSAIADLAEVQRIRNLGIDGAKNFKFNQDEMDIAIKLEQRFGVPLLRWPGPFNKKSPDWIDINGIRYDAIGPIPSQHFDKQWNLQNIQNQIITHIKEKADYVPVYTKGLTGEQIDKLRGFIEPYWPKVFLVV
ncbi:MULTISPECIES: hypothetical protein [unclassified Crossiella]|uniref:hypothetical protein n=1 Tax=unclassified Crossiella TaxID=2620835 RepID=UPI001FFFA22E|nr:MULTISPECIES: hypothetical protein [unclassified Crossiella]MCK2237433.1 hypothetical protein [Crossiella sp. S99.2]MCK2251088.1 hypothetical protein [Crossiella sp. S99.1]